jgi:hypothetical protein
MVTDLGVRHLGGRSNSESVHHSQYARHSGGELESYLLRGDILDCALENNDVVTKLDSHRIAVQIDPRLVLERRLNLLDESHLAHIVRECISHASVWS